jgi:hypothetical protein
MVVDTFGPMALRRKGMTLLGERRMSPRFEELQATRDATRDRLWIRGDSAYLDFGSICTYSDNVWIVLKGGRLETTHTRPRESLSTGAMERRLHFFKISTKSWQIASNESRKDSSDIILRNGHVILGGSQTACFFKYGSTLSWHAAIADAVFTSSLDYICCTYVLFLNIGYCYLMA